MMLSYKLEIVRGPHVAAFARDALLPLWIQLIVDFLMVAV